MEHPEDLGRVRPDDPSSRPASLWQDARARHLVDKHGWHTLALHQSEFGAPTVKPTRLIFNRQSCCSLGYMGWPTFDRHDKYIGPLPPALNPQGVSLMRGPHDTGPFRTAQAAAYPHAMCSAMAQCLLMALCTSPSSPQGEGQQHRDGTGQVRKFYSTVVQSLSDDTSSGQEEEVDQASEVGELLEPNTRDNNVGDIQPTLPGAGACRRIPSARSGK